MWLLNAETGRLVSLGVLNGTAASFELPEGLDLEEYPLVDVSREPFDGDPGHSSDSIARGELRAWAPGAHPVGGSPTLNR